MPMTWSLPAYEALARFVGARTGLDLEARRDSAEAGMRRAMARLGCLDPARYLERVTADARAFDDLITELTVGETYFFREPGQFEFMRRVVLPDVRQRRGEAHRVRAWSAGCASGEEPYSLAILFEEAGLGDGAHLLATDVCHTALARAERGVYRSWSLRGEGKASALPYLEEANDVYRLAGRIRRRITLRPLNLARDVYPSFATGTWGMDLILCRNVLIYLDQETVSLVAGRLYEALAEGGWLVTASTDPPLGGQAPFEVVVAPEGLFYRKRPAGGAAWPEYAARAADMGGATEALAEPEAETVSVSAGELPDTADTAVAHPGPGDSDAAELTHGAADDAGAAALEVRALANVESGEAERVCAAAAARHPFSTELAYLHAVLLLDLGRDEEAVRALRRVLYLDRSLALAHFLLGSILRRRGDLTGARRAFRNARDLSAACPPDQPVSLSEGEAAGRLARAADGELVRLGAIPGRAS